MSRLLKIWFPVILFVLGLAVGYLNPRLGLSYVSSMESFVRWVLFFSVGIQCLWAFVGQAFYSKEVAASIGWAPSPFLFEVAVANLGGGVAGIMAPWFGREFWLSLMVVMTCFLWGAFYGHVKDMIKNKNFAPNNVGPVFFLDLLIPLILWIFYLNS